jgi:hypothetical protein
MTAQHGWQKTGTAMNDRIRASNADRDRAAALLRAHFVAGRLTHDELDNRLAATLGAATIGDLRQALTDLPAPGQALPHDSRLERGYRRLLALYPARYRRVHGEEMLAVLMTSAAEGQDRPGFADATDLIIGALRVRCQTFRGGMPGWRSALALVGTGSVLGLLAGIPFASDNPRLQTVNAAVRLAVPGGPAGAHAQQAIASSYPVLAHAARTMRPVMSVQVLQSHIRISLLPDREMVISAQANTTFPATRAASAVADSYVAYVSGKNAHDAITTIRPPTIMYLATGFALSRSTDVVATSGLGALCGALIGAATGTVVLVPRKRRLRIT